MNIFGSLKKSKKKSQSKQVKRPKSNVVYEKKEPHTTSRKLDYRLLYISTALIFFGILMIYSASAVVAFHEKGSTFHFFLRQIVWVCLGLICGYIAYIFPLKQLPRFSAIIMVSAVVGLILVLVFGEEINGARRWIYIGEFSLQPSELAKLAFVIYLAAWLSRTRQSFKKFNEVVRDNVYNELLPFVFLMGIVCGLVLLQPDLDTAVIIALTALAVYYVSGKDAIHTLGTAFIVGLTVLMGVIAAILAPYRLKRVQVWIQFLLKGDFTVEQKRNEAFQIWNALLALANGGIFGMGYGNSTQKLYYLQETAWSDSIFAVIAEEFGLIGSIIIIISFLYFMSVGVDIAMRAEDKFSSLLAIGITTWITIQAFLNIGANLALVPFGGIPLPFLSYGGSNTLAVMIGVALLLNVSRNCKPKR